MSLCGTLCPVAALQQFGDENNDRFGARPQELIDRVQLG
jgi:hypothetical protein